MKRKILVTGLWLLAIAAEAQYNDRVVTINPLRNGDGTFVKANNPLYFNSGYADTIMNRVKSPSIPASPGGDPHAFRINTVQALCSSNTVQFSWTTLQPGEDADHFEIEQTADNGITWKNIATVPADRLPTGQHAYNFTWNKSLGNVDFRIMAVNIAGDRRASSLIHAPCSDNNLLDVTPNPVFGMATVRIGSPDRTNVKLALVNQSGVVVRVREEGLTKGINQVNIDMSQLPQGYYILNIVWPGGRQDALNIIKR